MPGGAAGGEGLDLVGVGLIVAGVSSGVGGAVNNAVRQLGGVIGTAIAVVLIGQPATALQGFRMAFFWIAGPSAVTVVMAMGVPANRRPRPAGFVEIESRRTYEKNRAVSHGLSTSAMGYRTLTLHGAGSPPRHGRAEPLLPRPR